MHSHDTKAFLGNKKILQFEFVSQEENYSSWVYSRYFYLSTISSDNKKIKEFKINLISKILLMTFEITCNLFQDSDML